MLMNKDKIQSEIKTSIRNNKYNGCILAGTGIGKGKIMVDIIKELKPLSILYICDNTILRDETFKNEVIKWGAEEFLDRIDMQCYQTTYKWKDKRYDLLLMDEADFGISPQYIKVLKNNTFTNKLLFTGTMTEDKLRIVKSYVPIIHELKITEAEQRSAVNKINVTYVNYELTALENARYLSFNEQFKKILNNQILTKYDKIRLKMIQGQRKLFLQSLNSCKEATRQLMKKLYNDHNNKILIFCGMTEQADKVCKFSFHGKNEKLNWLEKFNNNEIRVLSVVSKIDRGLNIDSVNNIIFESPTKSKTKTMQRSGRARRLDVDMVTNCFFMIPYYRDRINNLKPTVVMDYVLESAEDLDLANANILNIKV